MVVTLTALYLQGTVLFIQWIASEVHHAGGGGGDPGWRHTGRSFSRVSFKSRAATAVGTRTTSHKLITLGKLTLTLISVKLVKQND